MSRPRDRASAHGLLPRMEARPHKGGHTISYRYHPVGGKPVPLGTDREAAIRKVLDMNGRAPHHGSLRWLWEQWKTSKRYLKLTEGTQGDYALAWKQIDKVLGDYPAGSVTAPRVAQYVHLDRAEAGRRADIEKALLSNLFKHGIMLGVCLTNPTIGVEPRNEKDPDRVKMPSTLVVKRFLEWLDKQTPQRRLFGCAAEFASLAGSRQVEFLPLVWPRVDEEAKVIRATRAKQRGRKKDVVIDRIVISPAMKRLLERLRSLNRDGLYLFPTDEGNQYTARGFKTMCQRVMHAAIAAKVIAPEERFNFHGLRHYYTTVHKAVHGKLPNLHADDGVTARVYDHTVEEERKAL